MRPGPHFWGLASRPVRAGFAISSLHGGGAEFVVRRWTAQLLADGHEVRLYTYDPSEDGARVPAGAVHRHFPRRGRAARWTAFGTWLRRQATDDDVDVLVCLLTFTNVAALLGRGPTPPIVISERNVPSTYLPLEGRRGRVERRLAQLAYRRADAAIAISHPVAGDLVGGYGLPPERCFVVPNPVTDVPPRPAPAPGSRPLHLAFAGRLHVQKRPGLFVDVLAELAARGHDVRGSVVGEGPLRAELEAAARARGVELELLGWREPWWEAVADADCFLLASSVEGFGNVLVEAAAAGLPSVAVSSALGVADALVPGLTGELAATDAPTDLADAVLRAVAADPDEGATRRWLRRFSVQESTRVLTSVLEHVRTSR